MNADTKERLLAAIPELTTETLRHAVNEWRPANAHRQIIAVESKRLIETERNRLETCEPEELKTIQGTIAGMKRLLTAINAIGDQ